LIQIFRYKGKADDQSSTQPYAQDKADDWSQNQVNWEDEDYDDCLERNNLLKPYNLTFDFRNWPNRDYTNYCRAS
jgi:hypothetical protein